MRHFLAICAAGAAGTGARFLVNAAAVRWLGVAFPYGTLAVNLVGSCLLGVVMELALRGSIAPDLRAVLAIGVMGGFTTYSSFNYELLAGIGRGAWGWCALYFLGTIVGCLVTGAAGIWLARAVTT